ncbi:MAG: hypothetical protein ABSH41_12920 [Syntrophobacteraceae bacterium]|jgi:hypothetical protein
MSRIKNLKWYDWIGWLVNLLMAAIALFFILANALEAEWRAVLIGASGSVFLIGTWTWVLLYYGKPKSWKFTQNQARQ